MLYVSYQHVWERKKKKNRKKGGEGEKGKGGEHELEREDWFNPIIFFK